MINSLEIDENGMYYVGCITKTCLAHTDGFLERQLASKVVCTLFGMMMVKNIFGHMMNWTSKLWSQMFLLVLSDIDLSSSLTGKVRLRCHSVTLLSQPTQTNQRNTFPHLIKISHLLGLMHETTLQQKTSCPAL